MPNDYEGSQMYICDHCGKPFETDDETTGPNWFTVDAMIKGRPGGKLRIYVELQDATDSTFESWHTFLCFACFVDLISRGI